MKTTQNTTDPKWSTPEAAAYVGLSPRTLEAFRQRGGGPVFLKLGRSVLYRRSALDQWLEECEQTSTSEY